MKVSNAPKFTLGTSSEDIFNSHVHHNIFSSLSRLKVVYWRLPLKKMSRSFGNKSDHISL